MMLSNHRSWTPPQVRPQRHPVFGSIEQILHRAFPLLDDEPQSRLSEVLAALLGVLEHEGDAQQDAAHV